MLYISGCTGEQYKIGHTPPTSNITGNTSHRHFLAENQDPNILTSICNGMQPLYWTRHLVSDMY